MLNKYVSNYTHSVSSPSKIEVKEVKAPTDESIRLLNEMHESTRKNIISAYEIKNNIVEGMIFTHEDWLTRDILVDIVFKLNGHKFHFEDKIPFVENFRLSKEDVLRMLVDKISETLAKNLLLKGLEKGEVNVSRRN